MKISVEIDKEKLKLAKKLDPDKTLRALIDEALDAYIAKNRRKLAASLLGTSFFQGDLSKARANRRSARR